MSYQIIGISWFKQINNSIVDLRTVNEQIVDLCQEKIQMSSTLYSEKMSALVDKRLMARAEVVKANQGSDFIFGADAYNLIKNFTLWDESVPNLCSKPQMINEWKQRQGGIKQQLRVTLDKTKKQM